MKPFKFFFALSIGVMLFLFFAKIVLIALIAATVMSLVFGLFRKAKRFFRQLTWEEERDYRYDLPRDSGLAFWKEDLFTNATPTKDKIYLANHRTIIIQ